MRDPKKYSLGTASKATGKSKTTIQRAISKGLISAEKTSNGGYAIDPSELHRVFPMVSNETVPSDAHLDTSRLSNEMVELRVRLEATEAMLAREQDALEEARKERDAWKQQATALLAAPARKFKWWPWA